MYSTSVHCTVQVYNVQYKCTKYSTSVQCTVQVYNVLYKCTMYSTSVKCTVQVYNVQYKCKMYSTSVQCTVTHLMGSTHIWNISEMHHGASQSQLMLRIAAKNWVADTTKPHGWY